MYLAMGDNSSFKKKLYSKIRLNKSEIHPLKWTSMGMGFSMPFKVTLKKIHKIKKSI